MKDKIEDKKNRNDMFERFRKLGPDIQGYFAENLKPAEYYMMRRQVEAAEESEHMTILSLAEIDRRREYHEHKRKLSEFCGYDAHPGSYNQKMFDEAMSYLIDRMLF